MPNPSLLWSLGSSTSKMAPAAQIEAALAAIKTDESKILGLTIGSQKVTPGLHIPKAGKSFETTSIIFL